MNRKIIIFISCIAYVVAMISMFILVEEFIDTKKNRLYREMVDLFEHLFDGETTLLDEAYSEKMVVWENYPIPSTNNSFPSSVWEDGKLSFKYEPDPFLEDLYGDLSSLVKLNKNSDFYSHDYEADIKQAKKALSLLEANKKKLSHNEYVRKHKDVTIKIKTLEETRKKQKNALKKEFLTIYYPDNDTSRIAKNSRGCDGWSFISLYYNQWEHRIYISWLCPYAVGFKNTAHQNIGNAIDEAYNQYVNYSNFQEGSFYKIYGQRFYENEYYYILTEEKDSLARGELFPKSLVQYTYTNPYVHKTIIHNSSSKVFIANSQPITMTITLKDNVDVIEKIKWRVIFSVLLTMILLLIVRYILIKKKRLKKIESETLHQVLMRICHPSNYMKDYNKEKIDLANTLYQKLQETEPDNIKNLCDIENQVITKLNVKIVDNELLTILKKKVNPQQFVHPYNPEKLELANDLYNRLLKEDLTYSEYLDIREKANELCNKTKNDETNNENSTDESI